MNLLTLHFQSFCLDNVNIFSLFLSICPESFLDLMFSLKNLNFTCIKFRGPVLSQLCMYLISRSFCVGMCLCACVCVCLYKCDKSKQCYSCHMQNTISHINLRNITKFQKFINWKFKKFVTYTRPKILPPWNVVAFPRRWKCVIH